MPRVTKRHAETATVIAWTLGFDPGDDIPETWQETALQDAAHVLALIDGTVPPPVSNLHQGEQIWLPHT